MNYSKKFTHYFTNPKNYGKIADADGTGKVGNIICGDIMWLYIKVGKKTTKAEHIQDIKFSTLGCAAAIATSSMITELAKGKTLTKALTIDRETIAKALGGLPPVKIHCSVLATDALAEAIYDYWQKNHQPIPSSLQKRHRLIKKEKNIVQEKYGQWLKNQ